MQLSVITGRSGSGKSVALNALEDSGCYCVDNLPVGVLGDTVGLLRAAGITRVAVSIDARGGESVALLPRALEELRAAGVEVRALFLDARDDTLLRRFAETRRPHPLAGADITLEECLERERQLLAPLAEIGQRIDTSDLPAARLRRWIADLLAADLVRTVLLFESFGYKQGVPLDADLVFDVRCLPNPHYDPRLRPLTGLDAEVAAYLEREPQVGRMLAGIRGFLDAWIGDYTRDGRGFLTTAIGCTGGQHRSVWMVERLAAHFRPGFPVVVRHRQLPG